MCRLVAITASEYFSPMEAVRALETMKEGHDGSGMGIMLKNLGGDFEDLKGYPILSGICSRDGIGVLDEHMYDAGFTLVHEWRPKIKAVNGIRRRDHYFAKIYDYPSVYKGKSMAEKEDILLKTRLQLKKMGEKNERITVFSFYPDVVTLKEVGDPLYLAEFFGLDDAHLSAKIVFAQGRQNTNYDINLYACHPFFIQGYGSMTNGENTAFVPIREFLMSRGFPGYTGYNSDSEVFAHILHYAHRQLKLPLEYYKDVITPLSEAEIATRQDRDAVRYLKMALRPLCIDGPNVVIAFTPDGTCLMVHDAKRLRPGVVGGLKGKYVLVSELCGLDSVVPQRDRSADVFPMKYDIILVSPGAEEVKVWNQVHGWTTTMN